MLSVDEKTIDTIIDASDIKVKTVNNATLVYALLPMGGFALTESSGSLDPANYSEAIGRDICLSRIKDSVWELEGYHRSREAYGDIQALADGLPVYQCRMIAEYLQLIDRCKSLKDAIDLFESDAKRNVYCHSMKDQLDAMNKYKEAMQRRFKILDVDYERYLDE